MDMTEPLKPGNYVLEFLNGETRLITLVRAIVNSEGQIFYLEAADGRHYNWGIIVSILEA